MSFLEPSAHRLRRRRADNIFRYLCFAAAGLGVVLLIIFLVKMYVDGIGRLNFKFLLDPLSSRPKRTGIWPAIVGSLYVMALTALIAVPVGIASAIYLEEFNTRRNRFVSFVQLNIANLAGVPSIVYGLLGLAVFARWLSLGSSVITGALTMSLLILPTVIIVTQEALKAVPKTYREGSLALGSTRWQAIRHQVLPSAAPGIFTGIILSISRAIGETAPLIVVGAASYISTLPKGLGDKFTVLPIQIFDWSLDSRKAFNDAAAAAIIVLIVALLILNSFSIFLRARAQKRLRP
ncbi:MAG: phosphate ABC transporter, permease protein PstA [Armatimonadetes bacterium 55-13]|nr:phosphate ABC transporter permease PstA [Armatimonadota bacterium]OJU64400.1 MAG: phosphate ABC transporter, permease protein PstA [Armatimonadetes bacterium 55-13]